MMDAVDLLLRTDERTLISALDWQIEAAQCWCIIGRNGAGKSTLLRTLAGLREPDGGAVLWQRKALAQWPLQELARARAYLPQSHSDTFGYRAIDTVLAARHPYHDTQYWESNIDLDAAHAALDALDVAALAQRDVRTLSGGERRRVALAAVLAQDTPLLLLDEPALALDLAHQASMMKLLSDLRRQFGKTIVMVSKTIVMVSHDLNLAQGIATHALLLMEDGGWRAGPVEEIMQPHLLSLCLGYPIEAIAHGNHVLFVPAQSSIR